MSNVVVTIVFILFFISAWSQNPINKMYQGEKDGPNSDLYFNGATRCTYTILNGNLEGDRTCYYKNGDLWVLEQFTDGKFNGTNFHLNKRKDTVYIEKFQNDTLIFSKNFKYYRNNALKEIKTVSYLKDSSLVDNPFNHRKTFGGIRINYSKAELEHSNNGVIQTFYKSGKIRSIGELRKNVFHGKYLEFYESGALKIDTQYQEGKLEGDYILYDPNGQIKDQKEY